MALVGYQLSNGKYYLVASDDGGEYCSIKQILLGGGIYPAPIIEIEKDDWRETLTSIYNGVGDKK